MRYLRLTLQIAVGAMVVSCLPGCISVFPREAPVQLYRFGAPNETPAPDRKVHPGIVSILPLATSFDRAAAGDTILTVTGDQVAYIRGARWVAPASTLFDGALARAFDADQGQARLIAPGELTRPDLMLKLDVRTFEARYESGQGTPPTITVRVYAAMTRASDRTVAGEHIFEAQEAALANRSGAIADAFDKATDKVLAQLVSWVDRGGVN